MSGDDLAKLSLSSARASCSDFELQLDESSSLRARTQEEYAIALHFSRKR